MFTLATYTVYLRFCLRLHSLSRPFFLLLSSLLSQSPIPSVFLKIVSPLIHSATKSSFLSSPPLHFISFFFSTAIPSVFPAVCTPTFPHILFPLFLHKFTLTSISPPPFSPLTTPFLSPFPFRFLFSLDSLLCRSFLIPTSASSSHLLQSSYSPPPISQTSHLYPSAPVTVSTSSAFLALCHSLRLHSPTTFFLRYRLCFGSTPHPSTFTSPSPYPSPASLSPLPSPFTTSTYH